ncbi:MAG: 1-deoxy-D-xylulose-5-phosphate reductoisomerase [Alphaproteobacteria bacterium]|jgi:1-deoxy-D-xylulose-5-phosphate reductoisomerase|nr:1-deoxy-D-xylulose-5-phosphate reductoisomerase [Alphaproteobacteria bacterium]
MARKKVTVLGATGSIGCSTVDLLHHHSDSFQVVALTGGSNVQDLVQKSLLLKPQLAVIKDSRLYKDLKEGLSGENIQVAAGDAAIVEAAEMPTDTIVSSILGTAGLLPTLAAIKQGTTVALANKESLVAAGSLMTAAVKEYGATLLPVDSEHSAIFQCFENHNRKSVETIILTASGGMFLNKQLHELSEITPEQATKHPNWNMGAKITVDSATLVNKGLELIEAHYLFDIPEPQIDVVIHPQSIIHSMVTYHDGSVLAQLGTPDMRTPIAYSLAWPNRITTPVKRLSLAEIGSLTFFPVDLERFPALRLARQALLEGRELVFNAANEIAVEAFLKSQITFLNIVDVIEEMLERTQFTRPTTLENVLEQDRLVRRETKECLAKRGESS